MTQIREKDAMICRSCGNEERASEGYPCNECGIFICVMCNFKGVMKCRQCENKPKGVPVTPGREIPLMDWPEH